MLTFTQIQKAVAENGEKYGIKNAYLFGSYAKQTATEDSDVDIIIEKGSLRTYDDYAGFKFALEDELSTTVDVLTTEGVRPRFFELIRDERVLLYGA